MLSWLQKKYIYHISKNIKCSVIFCNLLFQYQESTNRSFAMVTDINYIMKIRVNLQNYLDIHDCCKHNASWDIHKFTNLPLSRNSGVNRENHMKLFNFHPRTAGTNHYEYTVWWNTPPSLGETQRFSWSSQEPVIRRRYGTMPPELSSSKKPAVSSPTPGASDSTSLKVCTCKD